MSRVIVGYGEYQGYRLAELPANALEELGNRYPLRFNEQYPAEYDELAITVAVHAELQRRMTGGQQERRLPTLSELAEEIVMRGFQQASRLHHPDGQGHHEAQILLSQARDKLRDAASNLRDDSADENVTHIPAPTPRRARATAPSGIGDDDVPF